MVAGIDGSTAVHPQCRTMIRRRIGEFPVLWYKHWSVRIHRRAWVALWLALPLLACGQEPPPPIRVDERIIRVENHTAQPWSNVEVWVNDHYRVTRASVAPGERLEIPLDVFVAGFGQRFNVKRTAVKGVQVIATGNGEPIRLVWGSTHRR